VPRFEPFRALRYSPNLSLADVCSPPYDVLNEHDRERYGLHHQNNIVHVDMPVGDEQTRYRQSAELMQRWIDEGVLILDGSPSFTIYRMEFVDSLGRNRRTSGVIGALEVCDEGEGDVLPHERTTPKAKTDRLELTRATRTNLSPVWGLSLSNGLSTALSEPDEELGRMTDDDGVVHIVERVSNADRVRHISSLVAANPVVIADGHHRYAISRTYRDECRAAGILPDSDLTLTYINELVSDQLSVQAIHRLYSAVDFADLEAKLAESFDMRPVGALGSEILQMIETEQALCLVDASGRGTLMKPREGAFVGVRELDSARLEHALRGLKHDVSYQHGLTEVLHELINERAKAAILIKPVSVAEIQRTAHEGLLMPPKSTFFTPKLRTGLVLRQLS
jgi:uncharacterized protein (DUF1015 family)